MKHGQPVKKYPEQNEIIEEVEIKDLDNTKWSIARVKSGMYLKQKRSPRKTLILFFRSGGFEHYFKLRDKIKSSNTEDLYCFAIETGQAAIKENQRGLKSKIKIEYKFICSDGRYKYYAAALSRNTICRLRWDTHTDEMIYHQEDSFPLGISMLEDDDDILKRYTNKG